MSTSPFDRFTPAAKRVLALAHGEAASLNCSYIGVEHILLGLIREDVGIVTQLFRAEKITYGAAKQAVIEVLQRYPPLTDYPKGGVAPDANQVVQYAAKAADDFSDDAVRPEHILFSLLNQGHPKVLLTMNRLGRSKDKLLAQLVDLFTGKKPSDGHTIEPNV